MRRAGVPQVLHIGGEGVEQSSLTSAEAERTVLHPWPDLSEPSMSSLAAGGAASRAVLPWVSAKSPEEFEEAGVGKA